MQLMIKPTLACQFKCDFCSAACYKQTSIRKTTPELLANIKKIDPDNIIITGGDPLMLDPSFFYDLLAINSTITLSLTTNLWDFYCNPAKWIELLKNQRVMVCTSFQYGSRRKKPDGTPFLESDFIKIITKFKQLVGYSPEFIAVISEENEKYAIDHVKLAQKLGIRCKLNGMLPVGFSKEYYPKYKMLDIQFKIIDLGLEQYESNTLERKSGKCPNNIYSDCYKLNRSMILDENMKWRYSFCEDLVFNGPYYNSIDSINVQDTLKKNECIEGDKCYQCKLFRFCNNCRVQRLAAKYDKNYCKNMSKYIQKLQKYGYCI